MSFLSKARVGFGDVDAAGIVFYPRYFEMLNRAVEDWFARVLGVDFAALHLRRRLGVPTVTIDTTFLAPSSLGDELDVRIVAEAVGRTSCAVRYDISCRGEGRVTAAATLVCMDLDRQRPVPWPDDIRARLDGGAVAARG